MNLFPPRDFLDCLGWTLLHFLWQGLVITAALAVALRLLRRRAAQLRYLAGCLALLFMALAPVATFYSLAHPDESLDSLQLTGTVSDEVLTDKTLSPPAALQSHRPAVAKPPVARLNFPELLEASLPWLVAAWSLGVLALSCRLFAGWLLIQRLRRTATTALLAPWQAKLRELARRIGVSRPLRLLQSACVEVPTVIGWLRPVILLPASCLAGLSPAQLESILAHELAHIRRHDYLVNLLQNIVETLLFYHPAVWWVSRRIRQEREHCCDDLAVKICGDPLAYARALATLEELRPAPVQLALAATGASLLERIRRLAGQPERAGVRPAWPAAGLIAVLLLALLAAGLRNPPASAQPIATPPATNQPENITAFLNTNGVITWAPKKVAITNTAPASAFVPADGSPVPEINVKVKFVELDVATVGTNVFATLFKDIELPNLVSLPATFNFSEFLSIQPTNPAQPIYHLDLRTNSYTGSSNAPLATRLSETQFHAVIKKLEQQDGVDVLTAPEITTELGRQVEIQAVDIMTIVTGDPSRYGKPVATNQPLTVQPEPFGPVIDVVPGLAADGHTVELPLVVTVSVFVGYEAPATVTGRDGKTLPKGWAIPHYRMQQFFTTAGVENAETLVLGGTPVPVTTTRQIKHKVPLLGDIPYLGHLFRSTKATTNTVQKILMAFVTPTLINADGMRWELAKHAPHASQPGGKTETSFNSSNPAKPAHTGKGRQAILDKLQSIRIPDLQYENMPLGEVINNLSAIARLRDPEKTGINFFISHETNNAVAQGASDPATASITIKPGLKDVRLADVLDAVTKTSDIPLKYSVLDYAVVFSRRNPDEASLETRTFHVSPDAFSRNLNFTNETNGTNTAAGTGANAKSGLRFNESNPRELMEKHDADVRSFFASAGVDLDTNHPANVGKAFAWNDRKGFLTVRATSEDLQKIYLAVAALLEIRTFHIDPGAFRQALADVGGVAGTNDDLQVSVRNFLKAAGADFGVNSPASDGKAFVYNSRKGVLTVRSTPQDLDLIAAVLETFDVGAREVNLKVRFALMDAGTNDNPSSLFGFSAKSPADNVGISASFSAIMAHAQYNAAIIALEQRKDVRFLDMPETTTMSGRKAVIKPLDAETNAAQTSPAIPRPGSPLYPLSPVIDVLPRISEDHASVELSMNPVISEFVGYDDPGQFAADKNGNHPAAAALPLPHFRLRELTANFTVGDGQTAVIGGGLVEMPPEKNAAAAPVRKMLLIFVTPTIIDPEGRPFHTNKERALLHSAALQTPPAK